LNLQRNLTKSRLEAKDFRVSPREIKEAYTAVSEKQVAALKFMKEKVGAFEKLILKQAPALKPLLTASLFKVFFAQSRVSVVTFQEDELLIQAPRS
jgi:histidinol dehydrogenase